MPELTKHQTVLQANMYLREGVQFIQLPEGPGERPSIVVYVPQGLWVELGEPQEITVAVEPGDKLNPEE